MTWEVQGRQDHGWFGHGTGPGQGHPSPFSPHGIELAAGGDPRKLLALQRLIGRLWGGDKTLRPSRPVAPSATPMARPLPGPPVQQLPPELLRFSQTTAGGNGGTERVRDYVQRHGTIDTPVDVVRTRDGLVSIDNTRVAVAREQGLSSIPARIWEPTDPIPMEFERRFEGLQNWGEVLADRVQRQIPQLPPTGTTTIPLLGGRSPR